MLGLGVECLESLLYADTPVGGVVPLNSVFHNCEFTIGDYRLFIDLILLDKSSFYIILGID